ncbi:MAG: M6 family metalloprotease domain-containing protein [Bacteroidales bacterium]|nr:M6 family metalloprotease domain-containing protein [Bacteroidales bacterium]
MKRGTQIFCIALVALAQMLMKADNTFAVIANPDPISYTQPDGSVLTILLKGDEFIHWAVTTDGYTIMTNSKGTYEYAATDNSGRLTFSGIQANDPGKRSNAETTWLKRTGTGLFFSETQIKEMKGILINGGAPKAPLMGGFPSTGTRKLLMILANFSNTTTTYTQTNFNNYMNQVNYNSTGSFRDYYIEVSYGQLTVNTTVTVWVTLPNTHDYYGPDTKWGEFAYQSVVAADNQAAVNFAEYDNNLDGIVDGVAIIHQGRGQEESGNTNDIWSHSWDLTSAGYSAAQRTFDGVKVNAYTTMPEKNATSMGTIGVMCHEFGHNLGAPDFYDTDYATGGSYTGTGKWDLMAGGSWNGASGTKPAHPNAWVKAFMNWTNPVVLTTAQSKTLRNAQSYPDVVRYNTTTTNEYFLCENRQQTGFDVGIPGHGLIIYHVDGTYISTHTSTNNINTTSHQGLYPVCANATGNPPTVYGTINGGGCPYPGTGNKSSFTDATTPHSRSWAGANTSLPLTNISENTTTKEISFCFISCVATDNPTNFSAVSTGSGQINLTWILNATGNPVMIAFSTNLTFGTPVQGTSYTAGNAIPGGGTVLYYGTNTSYSHTGLSPNTTYYYKAWSVGSGANYSTGVTANATTSCATYYPVGVLIAASVNPACAGTSVTFTATPVNGGTTPAYQWKVNGSNVTGATNAIYSFIPANNNTISCILTSNASCVTGNPATSNTITMIVSPVLVVGSISSEQSICANTTPSQLNGVAPLNGTNPTFQWQSSLDNLTFYNISGATMLNYQPGALTATTYYRQLQNAEGTCGGPLPTNVVTVSVNPLLLVSITITASANPVCAGTSVTFTAAPVNGGTAPSYQWKVNGTNVTGATNATYSFIPDNNNSIACVLTSNESCTIGKSATSNTVTMSVNPMLIVGSISSNQTICANVIPAQLNGIAPSNGTNPTYQWQSSLNNLTFYNISGATMLNYQPGALTATTYYRQLQNAEGTCGGPLPTNVVTVTLNPLLPVSVAIAASTNPLCAGTNVTFTANPVNGGTTPSYQWKVNGTNVTGATGATYSYVPANNNTVSCLLTSSETCTTGNPAVSNTLTMSVNPILIVGSISSDQTICANDIPAQLNGVTPSNGTNPTYQWQSSLDNLTFYNIIGATMLNYQPGVLTASTFYRQLQNTDGTCDGPLPTNVVTMTVNPLLPVSVTIAASANPVCAGTSVIFTAMPVNGGTTPAYQWKVNGTNVTGATGAIYSYVPANNNTISCVLTSSETCTTGNPATSNTVTMTVNPLLPVSVTIAASANPVCAGTSVIFTAMPVNGGTTPAYQWKVNGTNVTGATGATYSFVPSNSNTIACVLTSSETCTTGNPATSNTVTMTVNPLLPVSVTIAASANPVCAGTGVTFTANPVNGGTTPAYQWKVNGTIVTGATNVTYSFVPSNSNTIACVLTSSETCTTGNPATSNTVTMTVNPLLPVSVTIVTSANPVFAGTSVTFTASPVNGGTAPVFLWKVNGIVVPGATSSTYIYAPGNGDVIICILTSNATCAINNPATSNSVVMTVNTVPATNVLQNLNITGTQCFDALQTITVAGDRFFFTIQNGGRATMIAGQKINYLQGTRVYPGGYMRGYITTNGQYCGSMVPSIPTVVEGTEPIVISRVQPFFRVFPNPTPGVFVLDLGRYGSFETILVELYSMTGKKLISNILTGGRKYDLTLNGNPVGIYLLKVGAGTNSGTVRIIKQ